jgi:putative tryptophan/tyrosine transport system substrate-binding protein
MNCPPALRRPWSMKTVSPWPISAFWKTDTFGNRPMAAHFLYKRRDFITLLGGAAAAWPLAARTQQTKLPTIGFLIAGTPASHGAWFAALVQRLRELGWIEGRTVAIEYRWAGPRNEPYADIAAELVKLKVDVIVTPGVALLAAKQVTSVIPTVFPDISSSVSI